MNVLEIILMILLLYLYIQFEVYHPRSIHLSKMEMCRDIYSGTQKVNRALTFHG